MSHSVLDSIVCLALSVEVEVKTLYTLTKANAINIAKSYLYDKAILYIAAKPLRIYNCITWLSIKRRTI